VLDSRANGNKMTLDTIRSDFEFLDDWEDRYPLRDRARARLAPLARGLPHGPRGQVWLATDAEPQGIVALEQ